MDIQHLRYFITAASVLNFTKAAATHHIAQPSMSQLIGAMERELGVTLFQRNNKAVSLTAGGTVFLDEARILVARYDDVVQRAKLANIGAEEVLRVGYWGPVEQLLIPKLLAKLHRDCPTITLSVNQDNNTALLRDLESGDVDVVFSSPYPFENRDRLHCRLIESSEECAVVYSSHPLANHTALHPQQLEGEKLILLELSDSQDAMKLQQDCQRNGFTPTIVNRQATYQNLLLMVEAELGITLLPRCLEPFITSGLKFIALESDMRVDICVSWARKNKNPAIARLLHIIGEKKNCCNPASD